MGETNTAAGVKSKKKIVVLLMCDDGTEDFAYMKECFERKGFTAEIYCAEAYYDGMGEQNNIYEYVESYLLEDILRDACELWVMARQNSAEFIDDLYEYVKIIGNFFHTGHGVYFAGSDGYVKSLLHSLFGIDIADPHSGMKTVKAFPAKKQKGLVADHELASGISAIYEGRSIMNIPMTNAGVKPLLYGSDKKVAVAYYDSNGRRAIIDGCRGRFLNVNWDVEGAAKLAENCAAWLVNTPRFGD